MQKAPESSPNNTLATLAEDAPEQPHATGDVTALLSDEAPPRFKENDFSIFS